MKIFTSLLIGCSLALAGAMFAQQPEEQPSPTKGKKGAGKAHAAEAQPGANQAKPEAAAGKHQGRGQRGAKNEGATANEQGAATQQGAAHQQGAGKGRKGRAAKQESATAPAGAESAATAMPGATASEQTGRGRKGKNARGANAKTSPNASPAAAASTAASPATATAPSAAPTVAAAAGQQNVQAGAGAKAKRPEPQQVQQIKQQHANFRAQARPDKVPAVTFNQSYRIQGSERWQGPQYEVFRSYRPERHDERWYRSHYTRIELIGGGYYFWNSGYWYPAWGYSPSAEYYAYDGPIYVGHRAEPPDRVIADVQAVLQQMGYYRGEVDGLLGPLTREALTAYQADQGLIATAVIDQPTLDSLGMG